MGGDGWAYDIGFGGLDHVLSGGATERPGPRHRVYSNPRPAIEGHAHGGVRQVREAGNETPKKDLGLLAMSYGHVYVAKVAFGARMNQTVQAFLEAEAHPGPSLIIAYSHCIAHGYDMALGVDQQKRAADSGAWPLYRFDPRRASKGEPPLKLDSPPPRLDIVDYMRNEGRFRMVEKADPERFKTLARAAQREARQRYAVYQQLAGITLPGRPGTRGASPPRPLPPPPITRSTHGPFPPDTSAWS